MSLPDRGLSSFKSSMVSASSKLAKRTLAAPARSSPSPAPQTAAAKQDLKRKRTEQANVVYSQPADTGTGKHIMTQITYAVNYLKSKDAPQKLEDLLSYLSVLNQDEDYKKTIAIILQRHEKVNYDRNGFGGQGSYAFRPIHNIKSGDELLRHLQAQRTAQSLDVRELLEGWPGAEDTIRTLENEHKLLVIRNRKDDHAKKVWPDDPSLAQEIDTEFKDIWHKIKIPDSDTIQAELKKADLIPTNKNRIVKVKAHVTEKKPKKARRSGGKITNVHMANILRDYSKR